MATHLDETYIFQYLNYKIGGVSDEEIAEAFHVSLPTLARWKRKYKVFYKPHTDLEYIKLRKEGLQDWEIQGQWGMSQSGLYQWKVRNNIPKEYFRYEPKHEKVGI